MGYTQGRTCTAARLVETEGGQKTVAETRTTGQIPAKKSGGGSSISIGGFTLPIPNPIDVDKGVVGIGTGIAGDAIGLASSAAGIVLDPLDSLVGLVKFVIDPKNWLRVLAVSMGLSLLVIGTVVIVIDTKPELAKAGLAATGNPAAIAAATA